MTCREFDDRVAELLGGLLPDAGRSEMERHAGSCARCREEIASLRRIWELMEEIPGAEPRPGMAAAFEATLEAYRSGREDGLSAAGPSPGGPGSGGPARAGSAVTEAPPAGPRARALGRGLLRAAAALVLLVLGVAAGFMMSSLDETPREGELYLLLVYEPGDLGTRMARTELEGLGHAYDSWLVGLERDGSLLGWMRLRPGGVRVVHGDGLDPDHLAGLTPETRAAPGEVLGWVAVIQAASGEEAARIAQGCPALGWGARVEVRPGSDRWGSGAGESAEDPA